MLATVPPEILEHVALFVGTSELTGPPTDLIALSQTSRAVHAALAPANAPAVYAAVFRAKFDVAAPLRRVGRARVTPQCLTAELRTRFAALQRFRGGGAAPGPIDLWTAVFMLLENAGKNVVQLRHAAVGAWLRVFLLDAAGGSGVVSDLEHGRWPRDTQDISLALWLLWLCDANGLSHEEPPAVRHGYAELLRAYALGAPKYPVTHQSWLAFAPAPSAPPWPRAAYTLYGAQMQPTPPAPALPAILGYMARTHAHRPRRPAAAADAGARWDNDWARCVAAPGVHRRGALEGAWEGPFTYTEFSVYAALLAGAPPQMLHDGATGQNLQVWRMREYHLYDDGAGDALPPGDVLDAFFPAAVAVAEGADRAVVRHAAREYVYMRHGRGGAGVGAGAARALRDVVVFGEGHSSWGTFKLRGRVRSSDAFVTVLKEYHGADDRGRWLYRGYLVGGTLAGRWRDSFSPSSMNGYEGCFLLDKRV